MSITFHCQHCGNKISAKDDAVGKWGKCPACHNKIYVPNLEAKADDLTLAPIDDEEEAKRKELLAETQQIHLDILSVKEDAKMPPGVGKISPYPIDDKKLETKIIAYLRKMGDGKLAEAKELENQITPYKQQAAKILEKIALSEIPEPELADIPAPVLASVIRNLRSKIS